MKPHAFVAMPFGSKPGPDGQLIDFNRVYTEYIQPALEIAGMEVFRADQEQRAGDIITDMFQELLIADLVVAGTDVVATLNRIRQRGRLPGALFCDNGSEFTS